MMSFFYFHWNRHSNVVAPLQTKTMKKRKLQTQTSQPAGHGAIAKQLTIDLLSLPQQQGFNVTALPGCAFCPFRVRTTLPDRIDFHFIPSGRISTSSSWIADVFSSPTQLDIHESIPQGIHFVVADIPNENRRCGNAAPSLPWQKETKHCGSVISWARRSRFSS